MNNTILLSVIIPIYNVEQYLHEAVDSVINQTYKNLEIILVDDGSPDDCPHICDDYAKKDSRVKVIHKQNAGLGLARNSGLCIATGDYVAFMDSDDFIDPETYEAMLNVLVENNADCIKYGKIYYQNGKDLEKNIRTDKYRLINNVDDIHTMSSMIFETFPREDEKGFSFDASSCWGIFKMSIIKENKITFPSERELLSEDYVFHFNYLQHVNSIIFHENTYYHYRQNPKSLSLKFDMSRLSRAENLCVYIQQRMDELNFLEISKMHVYSYYLSVLFGTFHRIYRNVTKKPERYELLTKISNSLYTINVINDFDTRRLSFSDTFLLKIIRYHRWKQYNVWKILNFIMRVKRKILKILDGKI